MFHYRLRSLLFVTALLACGLGVYAYRQAIERDKSQRVDRFNHAIEKQHYELASTIAEEALQRYPDEAVFAHMAFKADLVLRLSRGEPWENTGFECVIVEE
jgi:hypothetical protein